MANPAAKFIITAVDKTKSVLDGVNKRLTGMQKRFKSLGGGLGNLAGPAALAGMVTGFLTANKSIEQLQKGFELLSGSAAAAEKELDFVRKVSSQLGLPLKEAGDAYLQLAASAKGTSLEGQATRDIFEAVARAMAKLGRSGADTHGALKAISQMMSKGKVSAEELRGQLGERLPGAFQAAARSIGVTTAELDKMLKNGEVIAEDMLPKFAAELNKVYDDGKGIETFVAGWNRFKNTLENAFQVIDRTTGAMSGLSNVMGWIGTVITLVSVGFVTVSEKAKAAGVAVGAFWDFMKPSGGIKYTEFLERTNKAFTDAEDAIEAAAEKAFNMDVNLNQLTKTNQVTKTSLKALAEKAREAAAQIVGVGHAANRTKEELKELEKTNKKLDSSINSTASKYRSQIEALKGAKEAAQDTKDGFDDLVRSMAGVQGAPTVMDVNKKIAEAQKALNEGDSDAAAKAAEKGADMLRDMQSAGSETNTVLGILAKKLSTVGKAAADASTVDEQLTLEKTKKELAEVAKLKQEIVSGPVDINLGLKDAAKIKAEIQALSQPAHKTIYVTYEETNQPGGGGYDAEQDAAAEGGRQ
ncbi:MAG: tape measure protein [Ketobacter sp.]|nr:tape measure protein [Ketobacter sp.]